MSMVGQEYSKASDRLLGMDFSSHNAEVKANWRAYHAGASIRTPVFVGTNPRYFMANLEVNPKGIDFKSYSEDPDVMFKMQLRCQRWSRFNLLQDAELGWPEAWTVKVDFQNYYEAAWFGCPIEYLPGQVPDTRPIFADCPERLMEKAIPDAFGGNNARGIEYYERFRDRATREVYLGRPIKIDLPGFMLGTDGLMTVACNLFGADFVCATMAEDPDRLGKLLSFITEATIRRIQAGRERFGRPLVYKEYGFADDSIALISTAMYREHILPHHRRLVEALSTADAKRSIHLCGDATRHFRLLKQELNIVSFDTGFPVDFGQIRRVLGPEVWIAGGPHVEFLMHATPQQVREECKRILESGVLEGGRFALREGNNLAPNTPLENIEAMYRAGREFGYRAAELEAAGVR